jgi:uncharacterized protein YraI
MEITMVLRSLPGMGALCGALVLSAAASAAPGVANCNVNMRTGPGTQHSVVVTIPAGTPVQVFECYGWCKVGFAGTYGYVSAHYISGGYTEPAPRPYNQSTVHYDPAPFYGRVHGPSVGYYYGDRWTYGPGPRHRWHFRRGDGAYFEFGG